MPLASLTGIPSDCVKCFAIVLDGPFVVAQGRLRQAQPERREAVGFDRLSPNGGRRWASTGAARTAGCGSLEKFPFALSLSKGARPGLRSD